MFLMGPIKQLKRMCDKTRFFATAVMLVSAEQSSGVQLALPVFCPSPMLYVGPLIRPLAF